jgi:hypothetical protein
MSKKYTLIVPDDVALDLEANDDVEILEVHDETATEKQAELQERMGLSSDGRDEVEMSDEGMEEEMRKFLRGERRTDPRLDN